MVCVFVAFAKADLFEVFGKLRPSDAGLTFQSNMLFERIDYIWIGGNLDTIAPQSCQVGFTKHSPFAIYASDHLGVVCDISIKATRQ